MRGSLYCSGRISIILTPIAGSIVLAELVILVVRKAITYILTKNKNDFNDPRLPQYSYDFDTASDMFNVKIAGA